MRETIGTIVKRMDGIFIVLMSITMMLIMMDFKGHLFLADDNWEQFYPVIERVYEEFIHGGAGAV